MKFAILDSSVEHSNPHERHEGKTYSDKYQHLDDLLDKTFLVDYFMDHRGGGGGGGDDDAMPSSNK